MTAWLVSVSGLSLQTSAYDPLRVLEVSRGVLATINTRGSMHIGRQLLGLLCLTPITPWVLLPTPKCNCHPLLGRLS